MRRAVKAVIEGRWAVTEISWGAVGHTKMTRNKRMRGRRRKTGGNLSIGWESRGEDKKALDDEVTIEQEGRQIWPLWPLHAMNCSK